MILIEAHDGGYVNADHIVHFIRETEEESWTAILTDETHLELAASFNPVDFVIMQKKREMP